jgi:hypothetical protein
MYNAFMGIFPLKREEIFLQLLCQARLDFAGRYVNDNGIHW